MFKRDVQPKVSDNYSWVKYVRNRISNNKNFLGICTGPTGSGKSLSMLSFAEMLDPEFTIDRVVFKGRELMNLINTGDLKPGSVILWDEAGIDLSNRSWQSAINKMLNFLLQTFRHRNFILLFTVPYVDFVDSSARKLFHAEFTTVSINRKKKTCRLKAKLLQYNDSMGKWYRKYLKVIKPTGGISIIRTWNIPLPSKTLLDHYEAKKRSFTDELNKQILATLNKLEEKQAIKTNGRPLTELQQKIVALWDKGITKQIEVSRELGERTSKISHNYRFLKNRGYIPKENEVSKQYSNLPHVTT